MHIFLEMVYKFCREDGRWENVSHFFGSTDYSSCYTEELKTLLRELGSINDTKVRTINYFNYELINYTV